MIGSKITLRIDRVVTDQPGLSRTDLNAALHQEITRLVSERGLATFGQSTSLAASRGTVSNGKATLPARVAAATLKAVTK
jgi:hypothetical protein